MRWLLRITLPAVFVVGSRAPLVAEPAISRPAVEAGTAVYADDLDTLVVSPRAAVQVTVPAGIELGAHWTADVISSASVDVVTTATRMRDVRHEVGGTLGRERIADDLDADVGYVYSIERDAFSHGVQGGLRLGLFQRNLEVGVRLGSSFNRLGDVEQPLEEWGTLWVHDLELSATLTADERTTVEIVGSGFLARGYQESPYRRVPIVAGRDLRDADWLLESVPNTRLRASGTVRARRAVGRRWVFAGEYRLYGDDWGVLAHTEILEAALEVAPGVHLRARERGVAQSGASFYRRTYDTPDTLRTRDRRLSPYESIAAGLALQCDVRRFATADEVQVLLSVDGLAWHFREFLAPWPSFSEGTELRPLRWVRGIVGQVNLRAEW